MKDNLVRVLLGVIGGSLMAFGITGIGKTMYVKGKTDAYKEISKDLNDILVEAKVKMKMKKIEESK